MENNKDVYLTKDLGEAAALLAKGLKLLQLEKDSDFYWFVFDNSNTSEIASQYWSGELLVSAKDYNDKIRSLKDRIFAQR